jgi:nicotinamide riboside transporter PnuC
MTAPEGALVASTCPIVEECFSTLASIMEFQLAAVINIAAFAIGQYLVTRRSWAGFLIWAGSNLLVATTCLLGKDPAMACLFLVYFAANVYSMHAWTRMRRRESNANKPLPDFRGVVSR